MPESLLFRGIADWLLDRALHDGDLSETVRELGRRLITGGVPVCRINVGGLLLHPVLGALDMTWDMASDTCRSQSIPRAAAKSSQFQKAPFYQLVKHQVQFQRTRLDDPKACEQFPLFVMLREAGMTDYIACYESYGRADPLDWADLPAGTEGSMVSFCTRRIGGFSRSEVDNLRGLSVAIALTVKMASDRNLAEVLLETYLGTLSGRSVLAGLVEKGDGRVIDCALWFSDLRGSTTLAAQLSIDDYFATINDYFDCTAGAVIDHGGEVLKYIGDGVLAIFPFETTTRPAAEMCMAAMMTAREALSRADCKNKMRAEQGIDPIAFGIGLHAGKVIYGNVGTERRLDLTVTGPAANEVTRLESLTKSLSTPVVASRAFDDLYQGDLVCLGRQAAPGIKAGIVAFAVPGIGTAAPAIAAQS